MAGAEFCVICGQVVGDGQGSYTPCDCMVSDASDWLTADAVADMTDQLKDAEYQIDEAVSELAMERDRVDRLRLALNATRRLSTALEFRLLGRVLAVDGPDNLDQLRREAVEAYNACLRHRDITP